VLQRRPSNLVDVWDRGRYFRILAFGDRLTLVDVENRGTIDVLDVRYYIRSGAASAAVSGTLRKILGLDVSAAALLKLARRLRRCGVSRAASIRESILLRGLGRLEVFPPGDAGAARGLGTLLQLDRLTSLDRFVERFGDHRGYLYFCGLGASLLAKGIIHAAPPSGR
jgi:hypothetical protein